MDKGQEVIGIRIGGKRLVVSEGQHEIARSGEWILHKSKMSPCGTYQNYKLYRDRKNAKKNVWYITTKDGCVLRHEGVIVLSEYYEGVLEWFENAIKGVVGVLPDDFPDTITKNGSKDTKLEKSPTDEIIRMVLVDISEAWQTESPLSSYSQSRSSDRYIVDKIIEKYAVSQSMAVQILKKLFVDGNIRVETKNSNTKLRGLKVVKDIDNG